MSVLHVNMLELKDTDYQKTTPTETVASVSSLVMLGDFMVTGEEEYLLVGEKYLLSISTGREHGQLLGL